MQTPEAAVGRRIAIIGPYPPFRGGIAHFTSSLHRQLEADGHAVTGVSFSRQYPKLLFPGKSQTAPCPDDGPQAARMIDSIGPASWREAAEAIVDTDVDETIFMYWMPFFAPAFAAIAARLREAGIRVSCIVHNASPHERMPLGRTLAQRFFGRCDRLVALSRPVASDLASFDIAAEPKVIPHPVYDRFGPALPAADARDKLGLSQDLELVLFFGLVRKYKGLDLLIEAMGRIANRPRLHLIVAGEFYEDRSETDRLIDGLGLTDRVTLLDRYIADADVGLYFSAADVVVQPYRSATQSGVVQTAYQFGRPVIVTDVGGLPEMVSHGADGLVVPAGRPAELARAISEFFETDLSDRLTRGAGRDENRMTWTEFSARLFDGDRGPSSDATADA